MINKFLTLFKSENSDSPQRSLSSWLENAFEIDGFDHSQTNKQEPDCENLLEENDIECVVEDQEYSTHVRP
jgi:hypothetical protein